MASNAVRTRRTTMDMTEGPILKTLITFAIPLLIGNLFQQLYNMVDTWVIGQKGAEGAYAAVGSVGPIINILIGLFSGLASGTGVVIAQYFGAKDYEKVKKSVHTAVSVTLLMGIAFTVIGVTMTPLILRLMLASDGDLGVVYPHAKEYLTIYFSGIMGMMLYNMGAGILRAVGDSRRPFYFLLAAAITNTVLDVVFVFFLDMGVAGVAYATVIAQWLSAILTVATLLRSHEVIRLYPKQLRIDGALLRQIVRIGFPAALQMALTAFSNVFVQSYIGHTNGVQAHNLGGWTTYSKIDQFIFLPAQSLSVAVTTFVGQNLGCGNLGRAKRGTHLTFFTSLCISGGIIAVVMLFAPTLAAVFNPDPAVVQIATTLLRTLTPFYIFTSVNQIFAAAMRGAGDSRSPMIIMLTSFVGFRQLYLWAMTSFISNDLLPVGMGYPAGWFICATCMLVYYRFFFNFGKHRLTKNAAAKEKPTEA